MKISKRVSELLNGHDFHTQIFNGKNSVQNVDGDVVLVCFTSSDDVLYLNKVSCFELLRDYFFHSQDFKRGIDL